MEGLCAVSDGASVTIQWRERPDLEGSRAIDPSHRGSCSVYMKKVESALQDSGKFLFFITEVMITNKKPNKARETAGLKFTKMVLNQESGAPIG